MTKVRATLLAALACSVLALCLVAGLASSLLASCGGGGSSGPPPPPPGAIRAGQTIGSASVVGRAVLIVPAPPRGKLRISESACLHAGSEPPLAENVVSNPDGTLRNVIVSVQSGLGDRVFAPPPVPAILDQKGCVYLPHAITIQTNQILTFVNSDSTLHNVHAVTRVNPAFNVGMAVQGQRISRFFPRPEMVKMKCDVHSWMASYVGVFDHPFHGVTGEGGRFELRGLPAGSYEIEAWHETYGTRSQRVTLADGETTTIEFAFGG